jgi:hypothetical protein
MRGIARTRDERAQLIYSTRFIHLAHLGEITSPFLTLNSRLAIDYQRSFFRRLVLYRTRWIIELYR